MQANELQEGQEVRSLGKDAIPEAPVQRDNPDKNFVEQFVQELSRLSGQVYRVSADMLSKKIIEFLNARSTNRVQMWEEVPGLDRSVLTSKGIQVQTDSDATFEAGIFGVLAAVAKTGTLVIPGGQGQPLTASLLPTIHITVLSASCICESLTRVTKNYKLDEYPSVVLVSGPSRTANIKMTLTIGVHGPDELHVFLIDDSSTIL